MRKQAEKEHELVEDKIHTPKFGADMPKEPYHPKGHAVIPHSAAQGMHTQHPRSVPSAQPLQQDRDQKNSMLAFLKEGIDKKHVVAKMHPPVSRQPVIIHENQQNQGGQQHTQSSVQKPVHAKSVRIMPSSLETLPEKKEKEKKIPLKQIE